MEGRGEVQLTPAVAALLSLDAERRMKPCVLLPNGGEQLGRPQGAGSWR